MPGPFKGWGGRTYALDTTVSTSPKNKAEWKLVLADSFRALLYPRVPLLPNMPRPSQLFHVFT